MTSLLVFSAFLTIAVGVAHSYLGERYILIRLFKRTDLPRLRGSEVFTKRILRFAWHLTSVAWWGYVALLLALAAKKEGQTLKQAWFMGMHTDVGGGYEEKGSRISCSSGRRSTPCCTAFTSTSRRNPTGPHARRIQTA